MRPERNLKHKESKKITSAASRTATSLGIRSPKRLYNSGYHPLLYPSPLHINPPSSYPHTSIPTPPRLSFPRSPQARTLNQLITPPRHTLLNRPPHLPLRKRRPTPITHCPGLQPLAHIPHIHQAPPKKLVPLYEIPRRARRQQSLARTRVHDNAVAGRVGRARVSGQVCGGVGLWAR